MAAVEDCSPSEVGADSTGGVSAVELCREALVGGLERLSQVCDLAVFRLCRFFQAIALRGGGGGEVGQRRSARGRHGGRELPLAAAMAPGTSPGPRPFQSGFRMPISSRSAFPHWSTKARVTDRTAVYGPVRTVVWQGVGDRRPYADQNTHHEIGVSAPGRRRMVGTRQQLPAWNLPR
jgi:hypothetical protein